MSRFASMLAVARLGCVSLAALCGLSATPVEVEAVVIYREVYAGANNTSINTVSWEAYAGNAAGTPGSANLSTAGQGPSPNLAAINSNPLVSGDARTFHAGTVGQPHLFLTSEYSVLGSAYTLTSVGFWEFHDSINDDPQRFVTRVGGNWYVTDQSTTLTGNTSTDTLSLTWEEQRLDLITATWRNLSFVPGSVLAIGAPTPGSLLPAGDITAFGLFMPSYAANLRFDSFELNAEAVPPVVPEPATWLMLTLGIVGLLARRRRTGARRRGTHASVFIPRSATSVARDRW